eukprot:TRINITY_DN13490_c1_g2_i1.p1 TRINITY_DN13490_c1_g2~~TRINITY_DN13490_c1_g2_i1.p1  ORF type:complete len:106 (+),score=15.59 TRINITY_DN13490_c1_g2_i1:39-356(+)
MLRTEFDKKVQVSKPHTRLQVIYLQIAAGHSLPEQLALLPWPLKDSSGQELQLCNIAPQSRVPSSGVQIEALRPAVRERRSLESPLQFTEGHRHNNDVDRWWPAL